MKIIVAIIILVAILYNLIFLLAIDDKLFLQDLWFEYFLGIIKNFDSMMYASFTDYMLTVDERSKKVKNFVKGRLVILLMIIVFCFILFNAIKKLLIK